VEQEVQEILEQQASVIQEILELVVVAEVEVAHQTTMVVLQEIQELVVAAAVQDIVEILEDRAASVILVLQILEFLEMQAVLEQPLLL
jgi:hypothetical protein